MFKLNLKIAFRSLWKNKGYTFINIFGLATGLASFVIILLYVNYETGFDKWDEDLSRVYRGGVHFDNNGEDVRWSNLPRVFAKLAAEKSPEIESISQMNYGSNRIGYKEDFFFDNSTRGVDSNFLQTYPIPLLEGDAKTALSKPNSIML